MSVSLDVFQEILEAVIKMVLYVTDKVDDFLTKGDSETNYDIAALGLLETA